MKGAEGTRVPKEKIPPAALSIHPVGMQQWDALKALFGKNGACSGCWCMYWRLKRADFSRMAGEGNQRALQGIIAAGEEPGLLAYHEGRPVGWCSLGPRERFPVLDRSPILKRVDDTPTWSIVCFFVARDYRGRGVMSALLGAGLAYAAGHGARCIEGYPVDSGGSRLPAMTPYTGLLSVFLAAGFHEVARRSPRRPIMRLELG